MKNTKFMKKIFLIVIFFVLFIYLSVQKLTAQSMIYLYLNDSLHIESITSTENSFTNVLANNPGMDRIEGDLYFLLKKTEYILFIPEIKTVFTVKSCNAFIGNHLLYLIEEIRKNRGTLSKFYRI